MNGDGDAARIDGMNAVDKHATARLRLDRVVVFVGYVLLGALTLCTPFYVALSGMRTTGCVRTCDFSLVGMGGAIIVFGCIGLTVVAFLGLLLLPRPNRILWWLPWSALTIAVAVVLLGSHLIDVGVDR